MVSIRVKVVPGASRNKVVGRLGDAIKVAVAAPPEKGRANAAVIEALAEHFGIAERDIELTSGHTQQRKVFVIRGMTGEQIDAKLG